MCVSRRNTNVKTFLEGRQMSLNTSAGLYQVKRMLKRSNKDDTNNIKKGAGFYHQVRHLLWNQQIPHKTKLLMFNYTPI